jgi:glutamate racemase
MIAIYDSGIGGASVLNAVRAIAPNTDIIYLADQARCPYGDRPVAELQHIALGCVAWLIRQGAAPVVVACNSASAVALADMRVAHPDVPFVGMVPAVKPAVQHTRHGVVGVMATAATLQGRLFHEVKTQYAAGVTVVGQACHGLVEFVEAGDVSSPALQAAVHAHLAPLHAAGADVIVLGCTHYPFLQTVIQDLAPNVTLIDPAPAVARQTLHITQTNGLTRPEQGQTWYYTTGSASHLAWQIQALGLPHGLVAHVAVEELV